MNLQKLSEKLRSAEGDAVGGGTLSGAAMIREMNLCTVGSLAFSLKKGCQHRGKTREESKRDGKANMSKSLKLSFHARSLTGTVLSMKGVK
jgi:hypothetical protein